MDEKTLNKTIRDAIKQNDTKKVMSLIENNPQSLHSISPFGTWLHVAAKKGSYEIVDYLVRKGIDVNAKGDVFDAAPIRLAAGAGHLEIVNYLLYVGTKLDVTLAKRNPLFGAIYGGHKNIVELLVEKGIDLSVRYTGENIKNMNAYKYAKEFGQTEIAEYIKQKMDEKI